MGPAPANRYQSESARASAPGREIKLYEGDALRVMQSLPDGAFDAIITDPPYAAGVSLSEKGASTAEKYTHAKRHSPHPDFAGDSMDQRTWTLLMADVLREGRRVCGPEAVCALFIDWRQIPSLTDALQRAGWIWRGVAVWDKLSSRPQRGRFRQQAEFLVWGSAGRLPIDRPVPVLPGVFRHANVTGAERIHQVQKPLELMREITRICVPGGAILDPFAGSGTTLLAAREEGFSATGIECSSPIALAAALRLGLPLLRPDAEG